MSTTVDSKAHVTPEDLLAMPEGKHYELVDGELVERNANALSSVVGATLIGLLGTVCDTENMGWVFASTCGYRCFPRQPHNVRRASISYLRQERLPIEQLSESFVYVAPDLIVEVVSPNDLAYDVDQKIDDFLMAGVKLIWVVNPKQRTVRVHRRDGSANLLHEHNGLDG